MEEPPEDAPQQASSSGEKTGRWTDEEHTRFLHGLELFGKKWTKVADVVGSRTTVQVRSHAQKYFKKVKEVRVRPRVARLGEWSRIRTPLPPRALAMRSKDWTNQLQLQLNWGQPRSPQDVPFST